MDVKKHGLNSYKVAKALRWEYFLVFFYLL